MTDHYETVMAGKYQTIFNAAGLIKGKLYKGMSSTQKTQLDSGTEYFPSIIIIMEQNQPSDNADTDKSAVQLDKTIHG